MQQNFLKHGSISFYIPSDGCMALFITSVPKIQAKLLYLLHFSFCILKEKFKKGCQKLKNNTFSPQRVVAYAYSLKFGDKCTVPHIIQDSQKIAGTCFLVISRNSR